MLRVFLFLLASLPCLATTWHVGATRTYTTPSAVCKLVRDGDTVEIDSGNYHGDVCSWIANTCTILGKGMVNLYADGKAAEQKAIWVIKGDSCTVDNITFLDCAVPDRNGAGIRVEGTTITITRCTFRNNQDGILAGDNMKSTIRVTNCEFDRSGAGDGLSHAIYVNHVARLFFISNYSHGTKVGHEYKSRARLNYIMYNRITNEDGTGSRNIDLPNGGTAYILGNIIHKGANAENGNVIGYGLEGMTDSTYYNVIYLARNTIVSDRSASTLLRLDTNTVTLRAVNNIIVGTTTFLTGKAATIDTAMNIFLKQASQAGFIDAAAYNYGITSTSVARGKAGPDGDFTVIDNQGRKVSMPIIPAGVYKHVCWYEPRIGTADVGAYEYIAPTDVSEDAAARSVHALTVYPNPASDELFVTTSEPALVRIVDATGRVVYEQLHNGPTPVSLQSVPSGVYTVLLHNAATQVVVVR